MGTVILWILGILLFLIVVLLVLPAGIRITADRNGTTVRLKILFFTIRIPKEKKEQKESKPEEKESKEKSGGFMKSVRNFGVTKENLGELLRPFGKLFGALFRTIRVDVLDLVIPAEGGSPEAVGRNTGIIWAVYGNTAALLANIVRLKVRQVSVIPDFSGKEAESYRIEADITASPGVVIIAAAAFLLRLLRFRKKYGRRNGGKDE